MPTTRLAPSPTGALHLGNARTFVINWALARQAGWRIVLRIEDLDGPRIKAGAAEQVIDTLTWLGLDWDEGPLYQAGDLTPYREALRRLVDQCDAYPCRCTRSQILEASLSAPHAEDHQMRYPGTCRPDRGEPVDPALMDDPRYAWRLVTPDEEVAFEDTFAGQQSFFPQREVGDFLIAAKGGKPGYQLAVVVDDARQGVDRVVRADDLLSSTPRQQLLYERLGLGQPPRYTHVPMVLGEDGRRLAKRHGDSRIDHYRQRGATAGRVLGLLAEWCGLGPRREMSAAEFRDAFSLDALPPDAVVFTPTDDRWLLGGG